VSWASPAATVAARAANRCSSYCMIFRAAEHIPAAWLLL
jgi:hypothetical protein